MKGLNKEGKLVKPKLDIKVVETEKVLGVPALDAGSAAAVVTLRDHPGFQYLLAQLRVQGAALKTALCNTRHKELKDVEFLQSGIAWCSWLQGQLEKAIAIKSRPEPRQSKPFEREAFEELLSQIDVIGGASRETTPGIPQ